MSGPLAFENLSLPLTRVRVISHDLPAIEAQLEALARRQPGGEGLKGVPVVVGSDVALDVYPILTKMRAQGLQVVGLVDGPLAAAARRMGLPVIPETRLAPDVPPPAPAAANEAAAASPPPTPTGDGPTDAPTTGDGIAASAPPATPAPPARRPPRIVGDTVRSGQQVYADTDLIILGSVSQGAEVISDGCIHVYGRLAGRALAGAHGDETARIFCRQFQPELVAVAGVFNVSEQLHDSLMGQPVQVWLEAGRLRVEALP